MTDQTDTQEVPLTTRLLMSASALNLLANSDVRRLQPALVAEEAALLRSLPGLLAQAASVIHGKQALLIRLMDAYAAGGGVGTATLEAIEAAIKRGASVDQDLQACKADAERALGATAGSAIEAVSLLATEHLNLKRLLAERYIELDTAKMIARQRLVDWGGGSPPTTPVLACLCGAKPGQPCAYEPLPVECLLREDPEVGALQEEAAREAAPWKARTP